MATDSRYPDAPAASPTTALNPNTQVRQETSTSTQNSNQSQSSFQGLTGTGLANTQLLIDKLLYGSNPQRGTVYKNSTTGQIEEIDPRMLHQIPGLFNTNIRADARGNRYTLETRITPSEDSVLNADPEKAQTLTTLKNLLASYSPDSATKDAETAVNYALQKAMETNAPAIQRAVENAGTSGGSMSALLSQDLAARAAGEAATLGLQNKQVYGQTSTQLSNTLAQLANSKDPRIEQLIQALDLTKASSSSGSSTSSSTQQASGGSTPLGISNPDLFQQPSSSASANNRSLDTSPTYYDAGPAPTSSLSPSGKKGSGYIESSNGITLFGNTTLADVYRGA